METESEKPPPQSQYTTLAGFGKTKITTNDTQATPPDSTPHSTNSNILKETLSSKTDSKSWRPALFCRPWTAMATATGLNIKRRGSPFAFSCEVVVKSLRKKHTYSYCLQRRIDGYLFLSLTSN